MKKVIIYFLFINVALFSTSCGVIGNIEKYHFNNVSKASLKIAVAQIYKVNPEFKDFDTTKYKEGQNIGDGDYYCRIKREGHDYFFVFAYVQYDAPNNSLIDIALTSAATYGENLNFGSDMGYFEKTKYSNFFEKYFIEQIKKELKK